MVLRFTVLTVDAVIDDVWRVELKILVANAFCVKEDIAVKEFVLVLMAASVEVVIEDVWRVELKMLVANAFCVSVLIAVI